MKTIPIIVTMFLFLLFFECTSVHGAYKGRVVDAVTGEPIEGVVVVGVWYKLTPTPAGESSTFLDSHETVTDQDGMFSIPGSKKFALFKDFEVMIFKAGYEAIDALWVSLKRDELLKKRIKWEGDMPIIPLRKLSMKERKERYIVRPSIPTKEMPKLTQEINKERLELGLKPL